MTIRTGDTVGVITGKDRGKRGTVERVFPLLGRVVVSGLNMRTHHLKPNKDRPKGGIIQAPGALNASKVMLACPHCQKLTRVRMVMPTVDGGTKYRACIHCAGSLDAARA